MCSSSTTCSFSQGRPSTWLPTSPMLISLEVCTYVRTYIHTCVSMAEDLAMAVLHLTKSRTKTVQCQDKNAQFRTNCNALPNQLSKCRDKIISSAVASTDSMDTCCTGLAITAGHRTKSSQTNQNHQLFPCQKCFVYFLNTYI